MLFDQELRQLEIRKYYIYDNYMYIYILVSQKFFLVNFLGCCCCFICTRMYVMFQLSPFIVDDCHDQGLADDTSKCL